MIIVFYRDWKHDETSKWKLEKPLVGTTYEIENDNEILDKIK